MVVYVDTEQAASHLGMTAAWLNKTRFMGGGPEFHKFGRLVRYTIADLDEWARRNRRRSTAAALRQQAANLPDMIG